MKRAASIALGCLLLCGFGPCVHVRRPVAVSPAPGPVAQAATSKAAAAVCAGSVAVQSVPASPAQEATAGELSVAKAYLPAPTPEDAAEALARVNAALAGDLETARAAWAKAEGKAVQMQIEKEAEQAKHAAAIEAMQAGYQAEIKRLEDEAARWEKRIVTLVFTIGGGLVMVLGALSAFGVMSAALASWPIVGPRLGASVVALGLCMIAAGQAIQWVLAHTWVLVFPALLLGCIFAFYLANRNSERDPQKPVSQ